MRRKIQRLLHVCKSETGAGVSGFWIELKDLVDDIVCDSREENPKVFGYVCCGVDAAVGLAVRFMLLVTDHEGAGEVEAALVELCFV